MAKNNSNGIAQGIMVIIFILIYPFVWLYDKLGAGMFWALITILFGGGLAWWGLNTKKKKENEKHKEKAFETMSVVIVYGFGMFCDNQCQDDNGKC